MIRVTRLDGREIAVNAELIATVEATPDTLLTLINGARILVKEGVEDVIEDVAAWRRSLLQPPGPRPV